jgi:hypothetical protein
MRSEVFGDRCPKSGEKAKYGRAEAKFRSQKRINCKSPSFLLSQRGRKIGIGQRYYGC